MTTTTKTYAVQVAEDDETQPWIAWIARWLSFIFFFVGLAIFIAVQIGNLPDRFPRASPDQSIFGMVEAGVCSIFSMTLFLFSRSHRKKIFKIEIATGNTHAP